MQLWFLFPRAVWAQPATALAGMTGDCTPLATECLVGMGSSNHCGGGLERWEALFWPLVARSAWAQAANAVAVTTNEGDAQASVFSIGVVASSHCDGGHER
jgi:hypothetical protein